MNAALHRAAGYSSDFPFGVRVKLHGVDDAPQAWPPASPPMALAVDGTEFFANASKYGDIRWVVG